MCIALSFFLFLYPIWLIVLLHSISSYASCMHGSIQKDIRSIRGETFFPEYCYPNIFQDLVVEFTRLNRIGAKGAEEWDGLLSFSTPDSLCRRPYSSTSSHFIMTHLHWGPVRMQKKGLYRDERTLYRGHQRHVRTYLKGKLQSEQKVIISKIIHHTPSYCSNIQCSLHEILKLYKRGVGLEALFRKA